MMRIILQILLWSRCFSSIIGYQYVFVFEFVEAKEKLVQTPVFTHSKYLVSDLKYQPIHVVPHDNH